MGSKNGSHDQFEVPSYDTDASKSVFQSSWQSLIHNSKLFSMKRRSKKEFPFELQDANQVWRMKRRHNKGNNNFLLERTVVIKLKAYEDYEEYKTPTCVIINPWYSYLDVEKFKAMLLYCTCCTVFEVIAVICECGVGVDFCLIVNKQMATYGGLNPELKRICVIHRHVPLFHICRSTKDLQDMLVSSRDDTVTTAKSKPNFSGQMVANLRKEIERHINYVFKMDNVKEFNKYFEETSLYHDRILKATLQDIEVLPSASDLATTIHDDTYAEAYKRSSMTDYLNTFHSQVLSSAEAEVSGVMGLNASPVGMTLAQSWKLSFSQEKNAPKSEECRQIMVPGIATQIRVNEAAVEFAHSRIASINDVRDVINDLLGRIDGK